MMRMLPLLGLVALSMPVAAQALPGWTLVWSDEFAQAEGTAPDAAKWGYDIGGSGWGNNELQYYTNRTQNARIENGQLVIEARAENFGGKDHTSARLLTKKKASWTFGRIEARIKIPRGQGIWPAFWMLGTNIDAVSWPTCGEIDIMENIGSLPFNLYGTLHGPGYSGGGGISGSYILPGGAALADEFHVYGIEWERNRIRWFIDGQLFHTLTPANLPAGSAWVFNAPQFLILNVAVGGNWPEDPDGSTVFPQRMTVDYVRVYQAEDGGTPDGNVLVDPGFEATGLPPWTTFGNNVYQETGTTRSGAGSLKVYGQFTGSTNDSGVYQNISSAAGDRYTADGWLFTPAGDKIAGANSAWLEVSFRDNAANILALHRSAFMSSVSPAGAWQKFEVNTRLDPVTGGVIGTTSELVAPAGTTTARKRLVFRQPASAAGSVWFDDMALTKLVVVEPPAGVEVTVDPDETWLGYMNVFKLPEDGGAREFGDAWTTANLSAIFTGPTLTLRPNSITDPSPYWYIGGGGPGKPGNKIMRANMYVEKTGTLSGKNITFSGTVSANTFTGAHSAVAFIKDFAADYSSFSTITAPLVNGTFSITLATAAGAGRHVQYGFETAGVNVWATDVGPFGSMQVGAVAADAFPGWISGFDFSGFTNPDLTKSGDPDGDGESNLVEFALDGDPTRGTISGKLRTRTESLSGDELLVLTLPVRSGAVFSGSPAKSAVVDGVGYQIEGSDGLVVFDREVSEVSPAMAEGMPVPRPGWSYRSFRLEGPVGGPDARGPAGFLRVRIEANP